MRQSIVLAVILIAACSPVVAPSGSPLPTDASSARTIKPTPTSALIFSVGADQARLVATLVRFVDAFNAEDVGTATALLTDDVVGNDCDYARHELIPFRGKAEATAWLRGRAADHDRLRIADISNSNPDPTSGSNVVAVSWLARTSAVLANPVGPHGAAKVVFSVDGSRIRAFANGQAPCDPNK